MMGITRASSSKCHFSRLTSTYSSGTDSKNISVDKRIPASCIPSPAETLNREGVNAPTLSKRLGFQVLYLIFGEGIAFPGKAAQSTDFLGSNDIILLHETVPFRKNGKDITINCTLSNTIIMPKRLARKKPANCPTLMCWRRSFQTSRFILATFIIDKFHHNPIPDVCRWKSL